VKHFAACIKSAPRIGGGLGGVYLLVPLVRGVPLVYCGQTTRATFAVRWQEHLDGLRLGYHVNDGLRSLWRAYGDLHACVVWVGPRAATVAMERWYFSELRRRGFVLANEVG
jgi:hypothetical protein